MSVLRQRSGRITKLAAGLAVAMFLTLLAIGVVGWIASDRALAPELRDSALTIEDVQGIVFEEIMFESQTGFSPTGRFFPGTRNETIILLHGFSERQNQVLPQVRMLTDAGFNVMTYNARHPEEYGSGVFSTLGAFEREDLVSAVDYLESRDDVDPDAIGVFGLSLGGATAILGAALDDRIAAVVAEGSFSDADSVIDSSFEHYIGLPSFPFGQVTRLIAERRAGARLSDARPVDAIADLSGRPVLLIHGKDDTSVPPDHSERNLEAGGPDVDVWWVPGAGHSDAYEVEPDEYATRLIEFFDTAFE